MKLVSIIPTQTIPIPGIRANAGAVLKPGEDSLRDWTASVRGPSVFLCSPPGWRVGAAPSGTDRVVFEIPRSQCDLVWEFAEGDGFDGVTKWDPVRASSSQTPVVDGAAAPPTGHGQVQSAAAKSISQDKRK